MLSASGSRVENRWRRSSGHRSDRHGVAAQAQEKSVSMDHRHVLRRYEIVVGKDPRPVRYLLHYQCRTGRHADFETGGLLAANGAGSRTIPAGNDGGLLRTKLAEDDLT